MKVNPCSFPKIWGLGNLNVKGIFDKEVEITEKVDGSQFGFGKIEGVLVVRSKGQTIDIAAVPKMFNIAVDYVKTLDIPDDTFYYCEYLSKPKHNALCYGRIPKNNLILFGLQTVNGFVDNYKTLVDAADKLEIDVVPLLFQGNVDNEEKLKSLLNTESCLGGVKIEGVVIKRYEPYRTRSDYFPIMCCKYVSSEFKEKHGCQKKKNKSNDWEEYKSQFKTEARWNKAIQHLKELSILEEDNKDIGLLIKEIQSDIAKEEEENIKDYLWRTYGKELLRHSISGFPEWYKEKIAGKIFKEDK